MKLLASFGNALRGFREAVKDEVNLQIHLTAMVVVVFLGFYFRISGTDWMLLLTMIGLVIGFELINTSIENLADVVTKEKNAGVRKTKDMAAAAVLVMAVVAVIVGFIIFSKYIDL